MTKRRAIAESDDEGGSEHYSKRSRTTETDGEEEEQPRAPRRSNLKGKGKERARTAGSDIEDDEDGDDMGDVAPDEDEEKKFEEEHEERIRERLMNKSKTQGVSGVVSRFGRLWGRSAWGCVLTMSLRVGHRGDGYHRELGDDSVYVPQVLDLLFGAADQFHYRCVA